VAYSRHILTPEGIMSYKTMDNNFSFTDLSLADSMEHNHAISPMEKINAIIIG
jgi:hypothetical protein